MAAPSAVSGGDRPALLCFTVAFRDKRFELARQEDETLADLAEELERLTGADKATQRILLPRRATAASTAAAGLQPAADAWRTLTISQSGIRQNDTLRLMGATKEEFALLSKPVEDAADRTLGFAQEARRERARQVHSSDTLRQLPPGPYTFAEFRVLHLPNIELVPPPSKALQLMHKLASDPGIVALLSKYKWRIGIMTELAPVGFVGVSPKCLLGFNKNRGEEISLRLLTDNLDGFRKYISIKKTLLHELAHMLHDEHDVHFKAFDSQLNKEVEALDWTRQSSHYLGGSQGRGASSTEESSSEEEDFVEGDVMAATRHSSGSRIGGSFPPSLWNAQAAAGAAALQRLGHAHSNSTWSLHDAQQALPSGANLPDPLESNAEPGEGSQVQHDGGISKGVLQKQDNVVVDFLDKEPPSPLSDAAEKCRAACSPALSLPAEDSQSAERGPPSEISNQRGAGDCAEVLHADEGIAETEQQSLSAKDSGVLDAHGDEPMAAREDDDGRGLSVGISDTSHRAAAGKSDSEIAEVTEQPEVVRLQDAAASVTRRVEEAMRNLRSELPEQDVKEILETLLTILRNAMYSTGNSKFRQLRKANKKFHERVGQYPGALEVLHAAGFADEDFRTSEDAGRLLVLRRDDPGLLWLVSQSLTSV
eukprot:SM000003S11226  [mRNA]  locus=s3:1739882:1744360:+ [translate_table: standard]